ncbi:MAG: restriction endonuclease subunit S, partial [Planctomycetota bacterium]
MASKVSITKAKVTTRAQWTHVRFGDVVRDVKATVDRDTTNLTRYIAGEHMNSDDVHLRCWGELNGDYLGPAFHRGFRAGQVLYGSRRTYLKKVAVAPFDGICANTTFVLESRDPDVLLPELLPFLMLTDAFTQHSIRESKGSVNPYINWKDIAKYELLLPPKDEQRRIANVLWAADKAVEAYIAVYDNLVGINSQLLTKLTTTGFGSPTLQATSLGSIASDWTVETVESVTTLCQYGLSIPLNETGTYPILRMMNYDDGEIVANDLKYVDLDERDFLEYRLERNDILFNRTNSADLVGKVGIFRLDGDYVFASYLVRLRADLSKVLPEYLNAYLNSELGQRRLLAYATPGVSQTNISAGSLKKVLVPVPPLDEQPQIVEVLESLRTEKRRVQGHIEALRQVKSRLMSELLIAEGDQ